MNIRGKIKSGHGVASGPYLKRPGQDLLAQSISGGAFLNGKKGDLPVVTAVGQADLLTSLFIVQSVLAAIYARNTSGKGQKIEANLLNLAVGFHVQEVTAFLHKGENPERSESGIPNPWIGAPYGLYDTSSGYIAIGMSSVRKVAKVIGLEKYNDEQFNSNNIIENRDEIRRDFNNVFKTKSTDEWLELLLADDVWCSEVNSFTEMVEDPQIKHNNMIMEYEHLTVGTVKTTGFLVSFSETPQKVYRPAPLLSEHAAEILKKYCDYKDDKIDAFLNKKSYS